MENIEKNMVKLTFEKVEDNNFYVLKDENGNMHELVLEFYGLSVLLSNGDKILMHEALLNRNSPKYTQPYAFELDFKTASEAVLKDELEDNIILRVSGKNFVLKRIYG